MEASRRVRSLLRTTFYMFIDISAGDQQYIEDCQICCQPIEFRISIEDGEVQEILADPAKGPQPGDRESPSAILYPRFSG